ncbi:trypsin-like serine peptidase [Streptomyces virginiae]|uniref:trypsin-like serine peptidase n=1 Tax=Streptomyces virginiae TaxID=1961 RepID=UPI0036E29621
MRTPVRIKVSLGAAAVAALLAAGSAQASAPDHVTDRATGVAVERSDAGPGRVKAFWTQERIKEAVARPADLPTAPDVDARPLDSAPAPASSGVPASASAVAPKNRLPGSGDRTVGTFAPTDVTRSIKNAATASWPFTPSGWLVYYGSDGSLYSCSAAVIVHSNKSTVWTAAHCLHGGKGGGYSKNAAFVPAKNGDDHPFGVWEKVSSYVPTKWIQDSDVITGDMAAFTVRADPTLGGFVQDVVGAYGYEFRSNSPENGFVHSIGYPGDGYGRPNSDYSGGAYQRFCTGPTVDAAPGNPLDQRLKLNCEMGHGASGGPMVKNLTGDARIVGVNSHRKADSNGNWVDNYMYSSEHGSQARSVYSAIR